MRPIKFRAWDKKRKLFVGSDYPNNWGNDKDEWWTDTALMDLVGIEKINENERFVVQQFTGLLDRKGRMIYEGDILAEGAQLLGPLVVKWDQGLCGYELRNKGGNLSEHLLDLSGPNDLGQNIWEVIGNIYEHPNLLKNG